MIAKRSALEIEEEAAAWATRLELDDLSLVDEQALQDWLATDIRCVGALARAEAYVESSKRASAFSSEHVNQLAAGRKVNPAVSRRQFYRYGAAALGMGMLGIASYAGMAAANTYRTQKGETKVVTLSDGSVVNLNTHSAMRVYYKPNQRLVRLLDGEALFEVAPDPQRPFVVEAGSSKVISEVSSFSVSFLTNKPLTVLVRDGAVKLGNKDSTKPAVLLDANMLAQVVPQKRQPFPMVEVHKISPEQVRDDIAWKMGRIAFRGESLGNAASEFSRYSDVEIEINDTSLANERIAGVFQANDPVGFAHTVADSFGLAVEINQNKIYLARKKTS